MLTNQESSRPTSSWITAQYLAFFQARAHQQIDGSPLVVPGNSTSFVIAGMQPLLPYLRGSEPPPAPRLVGWQRCLRTNDVEAVGTNPGKLTSFHMLGQWSIADYGRREAIEMARDFLLDVLQLPWERLWATVLSGVPERGLGPDELAIDEWLRVGMPRERIVLLGEEDNLWTMGGPGPCGPCTEIFFDRGVSYGCGRAECQPGCECERFLEIWNLVFMEYEWLPSGALERLPFLSIDTGMGLERVAMVLQETESVFAIDLFQLAQERLRQFIGGDFPTIPEGVRARRLVLDHARAALFITLEGITPGRDGRSSVLRRLIRRAARQGRVLGIEQPFLSELLEPLASAHTHLLTSEQHERVPELVSLIADEEQRFTRVLTRGLPLLERLEPQSGGVIAGAELYDLLASHGFPSDLAAEILAERGLTIDWPGYQQAQEEHRLVSRASAERRFQL